MAQTSTIVCRRSDLPKAQRQSIQNAIELLWKQHVKEAPADKDKKKEEVNRWSAFAQALKESLDRSCEAHWHVMVGREVGYACKKRDRTMGAWRIDNCTVLIWKSPGIELVAEDPPKQEGETEENETETSAPAVEGNSVRVLDPKTVETDSEIERVIAALKAEAQVTPAKDPEVFAQSLRKRLTKECGTIWHVVVGTEFVVQQAQDRRNYVLATVGKARVVCFQHEQLAQTKIEWEKIMKSIPYLLAVIFCFGYMGLNYICDPDYMKKSSHKTLLALQGQFCGEDGDWHSGIGMVGAGAIATLVVGRTLSKVASTTKNKIA